MEAFSPLEFTGAQGAPSLTVLQNMQQAQISCERAALVVRAAGDLPVNLHCKHCVGIVDSGCSEAREAVAAARIPALTCGLSGTDTLTFSSLTTDSAVLCLRRAIHAFDGSMVEPFELPVHFTRPIASFELLACAAVFCLLGKDSPLDIQKIWNIVVP